MRAWTLIATLGLVALAARRPPAAGGAFVYPPAVPGGKNLIPIPGMPATGPRPDLPQAVHYYAQDLPLQVGDRGSLVTLVQRMLGYRGLTVAESGVIDPLTMAAAQAGGYTSVDWYAGPLTEAIHADDLRRLATEHPALVGGLNANPFKPSEG